LKSTILKWDNSPSGRNDENIEKSICFFYANL